MPDLNYSGLRLLWDIAQSVAVLALFVWTAIDRKRQQNSVGIDQLKAPQAACGLTSTSNFLRQPPAFSYDKRKAYPGQRP